MHRALLGFAALTAFVAYSPAQGQSVELSSFTGSSGLRNSGFVSPPIEIGPGHYLPMGGNRSCRGEHCRHVHVSDNSTAANLAYGYGYGAGGYYDYGDYDANRSFSPDKWNDWWHERPERAFPRWMQHNESCERIWYSGGGWRC